MIERDSVDAVEERQVVLIGRVVAVPRDDIERRVIDGCRQSRPRNLATMWKSPSRSS